MSDIHKPLTMTRHFTANREKVWQAWTTPEIFSRWFSPDGFIIPICELEVRPGGKAYLVMEGPDHTQYPLRGTYEEVIEPERLVWLSSPLDEQDKPLFEIRQTFTFREEDGGTTVEILAEVISAGPAAAPYLAGMKEGLTQSLTKLSALL